tara:strand:- start:9 stop:1214 length:1206 start_codon:yes stop_codon:yes gene_type:complete
MSTVQPSGRPRIAIITRSIDRSRNSGSGHHLHEMVRHLIPQASDLDIHLAHYQDSDDPIYDLAPEIRLPANPLRAAAVLNRHEVDVVHFSPLTIVSPINGLRARTVATIHSAEPMLLPEAYSWIKRVHSRYLIPRYARRLDTLVTVSETSRDWFAEHYGVPRDRIVVTYNACSPAYRQLSETERSPATALDPRITGPFVFHVSRFSERKNPWTMLSAFAELVSPGRGRGDTTDPAGGAGTTAGTPGLPRDLQLVLAGKGWDDPSVWQRARELGIADRMVTPGFVDEETVVGFLNRAEVFWFPSLSEGFGMPNVEAMTCGCPVITSAVFAIPEVVGEAAIVLEDPRDHRALADATASVLSDGTLRQRLVRDGLEWSRRYDWNESARTLANVYRRLAGRPEQS